MLKKIFIVGSDYQWEEQQLEQEAKNLGYFVQFILLERLSFHLSTHTKIFYERENILEKIDQETVFIIRRSRGAYEKLVALVNYLDKNNIQHTDSFRSVSTNLNKKLTLTTISSSLLPHPPGTTFLGVGSAENIKDNMLNFPCVMKPVMGRHGEGVEIIDNFIDLQKRLAQVEETQIIQEFIEIKTEYRVFVIKNNSLGVIKKIPPQGSNVANYSAGAEFIKTELSKSIVQESIRICQDQHIDIGGVDVAESKQGNFYLLEVNRCPEFKAFSQATNINVALEIVKFI
jgi:RimK family alpha-L-glutamate ligase